MRSSLFPSPPKLAVGVGPEECRRACGKIQVSRVLLDAQVGDTLNWNHSGEIGRRHGFIWESQFGPLLCWDARSIGSYLRVLQPPGHPDKIDFAHVITRLRPERST